MFVLVIPSESNLKFTITLAHHSFHFIPKYLRPFSSDFKLRFFYCSRLVGSVPAFAFLFAHNLLFTAQFAHQLTFYGRKCCAFRFYNTLQIQKITNCLLQVFCKLEKWRDFYSTFLHTCLHADNESRHVYMFVLCNHCTDLDQIESSLWKWLPRIRGSQTLTLFRKLLLT